jgi:hypothetical protein
MKIELSDVSESEMQNFLMRFLENSKEYLEGMHLPSAVEALNDTLGDVGVNMRLYHDAENDYGWAQ